jgi:hypothetical protein
VCLLVQAQNSDVLTENEHVFDTVTGSGRAINPLDAPPEWQRQRPANTSTWDALAVPDRGEIVGDGGYIGRAEEYVSAFVKERGSAMSSSTSHEEDGPPGQVCSACLP